MNLKTKIALIIAPIVGCIAIAVATPIVNLSSPILGASAAPGPLSSHGVTEIGDSSDYFNARLTTDGPSTIAVQDVAYAAGGQNGWHAHPGIVLISLLAGSIEWYDVNCNRKVYNAGDAWTEGSQVHAFRVTGTAPVHLFATYVVSRGAAYRTDKSAPACAAGLGL